MAIEVRHFAVTLAAGSTPGAPVSTQIGFPDRVVDWVEIDVPPGPKGTVGWYIASSGAQMVPWTATPPLYVVADDRQFHYDLTGQPTTGDWQLIGYNQGNFAHTIRVTFGLELTEQPGPYTGMNQQLPASQVSS